ncbi:MAG: hypothetical protein ACLPH3_20465 [Terracidiphilus sp.]
MMDSIAQFEIEEHVAETNQFFKLTGLTLDDLNTYAKSLAPMVTAAHGAVLGTGTLEQANDAMRQGVNEWKQIDAAIGDDEEEAA